MVLLAASVCTKKGKAVVSRQFVEMQRPRIEGLLAAFPKLIGTGKEHTFVETDAVRYVYQPLESLFVVLITTKNSNILEDLETLRMFAKVIPEYCKTMTMFDVGQHAFELIFAFDEIVALGYRESVNLQQIRTFTEMISQEEENFLRAQKRKEDQARIEMKRKMKEMERERREFGGNSRTGIEGGGNAAFGRSDSNRFSSGFHNDSPSGASMATSSSASASSMGARSAPTAPKSTSRGMKLGGNKVKSSGFVESLVAEGELVEDPVSLVSASGGAGTTGGGAGGVVSTHDALRKKASLSQPQEKIHVSVEEKLTITARQEGGLDSLAVSGSLFLNVSDPELASSTAVVLALAPASSNYQFRVHPTVNADRFASESTIAPKSGTFAVNANAQLLRWKLQSTDESLMPLTILCWPSPLNDGSSEMTIEYELARDDMQLHDVIVSIPIPAHAGVPTIAQCDGDFKNDTRRSVLEWFIPLIDKNSPKGSIEFKVGVDDTSVLFPVQVHLASKTALCGLSVARALGAGGADIPVSSAVSVDVTDFKIL